MFSCEYCKILKSSSFYRGCLWISVILWATAIINFNRALENLGTIGRFQVTITNFLAEMGCSTKGDSYCCFNKVVSNNYFQKILLINFISTYATLLKNLSFVHFLLIEVYGKYSLQRVAHCSFCRAV